MAVKLKLLVAALLNWAVSLRWHFNTKKELLVAHLMKKHACERTPLPHQFPTWVVRHLFKISFFVSKCYFLIEKLFVFCRKKMFVLIKKKISANYLPTIGQPLANHWPTICNPLANHWSTVGQPFFWPTIGQPFAKHWPTIGQPLARHGVHGIHGIHGVGPA